MEPDGESLPVVRQWPANEPLDGVDVIAINCPGCGSPWRVHPDLAGFRLRCNCGGWIAVPARPRPSALALPFDDGGGAGPRAELPRDADGLFAVPAARGQVSDQPLPVHLPMAPGALQHGNVVVRQRWTNAAFLELALMMTAFLLPHLLASLALDGEARALALPFVSMATGIVVVLIAAVTSPYAFRALRNAPARHFAEAALAAFGFALLAVAWVSLIDVDGEARAQMRGLRTTLGTEWALFVIAVCPALFEELAFRGAIQGRFLALLGRTQGLLATGVCFALCHGVTAGFPFHVGLGLYLGWLRERSGSLYPGMVTHALYNGAILLAS